MGTNAEDEGRYLCNWRNQWPTGLKDWSSRVAEIVVVRANLLPLSPNRLGSLMSVFGGKRLNGGTDGRQAVATGGGQVFHQPEGRERIGI